MGCMKPWVQAPAPLAEKQKSPFGGCWASPWYPRVMTVTPASHSGICKPPGHRMLELCICLVGNSVCRYPNIILSLSFSLFHTLLPGQRGNKQGNEEEGWLGHTVFSCFGFRAQRKSTFLYFGRCEEHMGVQLCAPTCTGAEAREVE